ncbi:MAG: glycosyltransferase [Sandaracinaceae bacterium]|nr:glycosyltransferase [Sandaracinaceae bacterium]
MTPRPDVSVLLPFRDAEATLAEAMASILAEREVALELVAVDDGSCDASAAIARSFGDPRVRVLSGDGAGIARALERARTAARGRFLARMDADDRSLPGRLGAQLAALEASPRLGAVGCRVRAFPDERVGDGLRAYVEWQNSLTTPADHRRQRFVEATLCHPSVTLRREAVEAVGGWRDELWPEDYALWLRLHARGWALAKVPEALFEWRHSEGRATFTDPRYAAARVLALRARFLARAIGEAPLTIWGAGKTGRRLARALEAHGVRAQRFVDIDPAKIGRTARGAPIVGPEAVAKGGGALVVAVGARGARAIVRARLRALGLVEEEDFLCAA